MSETTPMPTCPMAATCKAMLEKPSSSLMLFIPGIIFIVLGVLIVIQPNILDWLVAALFVVMGVAMLGIARLIIKTRTGTSFD
jgi:membrane protein YdbS with pleckstrin-like domain